MDYKLSLIDNKVVEDTETFTVSLSVVTEFVGIELGTDSVANVTILDDDSVTVQFEVFDVTCTCRQDSVIEVTDSRGSLTVSVVKTGLSDIPVTVFVRSEDRTATGE